MILFGSTILFLLFILFAINEAKQDIVGKLVDVEYEISRLTDMIDDHDAPICMRHLQAEEEEHEDC